MLNVRKARKKYKVYYEGNFEQLLPRSTRYYLQKRHADLHDVSEEESSIDDMKEFYNLFLPDTSDSNSTNENGSVFCESDSEIPESINSDVLSDEQLQIHPTETLMNNANDDRIFEMDDLDFHALPDASFEDMHDYSNFYNIENGNDDSEDELLEEAMDEDVFNNDKTSSTLKESLDDKNFNETLDASLIVSECEIMLAILKFASNYSLPNCAVEDLCKMLNCFFNKHIVCDTRYRINKMFNPNTGVEYHAICPKCDAYIRKFDRQELKVNCPNCETYIPLKGNNNFFVILNVENEIQSLIENNQEYYDFVVSERERIPTEMHDIYDGALYEDFIHSLPFTERKSYATCLFNSDGSPVFKSSTFSVWPVQIIVNELPVNVRISKSITFALWFGKKKPNMNIFLKPFVDKMNQLSTEGVLCKVRNEVRNIKIYAICCCVDSVARAPMQGNTQFNGRYGCSWCLHPGIPTMHKQKKTLKYTLLHEVPAKRTEYENMNHMEETLRTGKPVYGVKGVSVLITLKKFSLINGFVPDYMHFVALGVCRQFGEYWFNTTGQAFSLSNNIKTVDKLLSSLKVPSQVARLSRSITERKFWKAREWENWLLYFSLPVLKMMPHFQRYERHWALLVEAMHILMSRSVNTSELLRAEKNLKEFVAKTEMIYSADAMTFNIHQLLHITESVIDWGPLWAHSGYGFESGNGQIITNVKAAKGVLHQICRSIAFNQSATILQKHVNQNDSSPVIHFCTYLENRNTGKTGKIFKCRYFGKALITSHKWIERLQLSEDHTVTYHRMIKENCIYTSCRKNALRSSNCFAQICDGEFIAVVEFIIDKENLKEYTICKKIVTQNDFVKCNAVKRVVNIDEDLTIIETEDIENIAVFMNVNRKRYISAVPNMFHYKFC